MSFSAMLGSLRSDSAVPESVSYYSSLVPVILSVVLTGILFLCFICFRKMRRRMIGRIVMWQSLVDCLWLGLASDLLFAGHCWSYMSDCLLFTASSGWTVSMAVQIFVMSRGMEARTERWDLWYHLGVWSAAFCVFSFVMGFSGGRFDVTTEGICEPRHGFAKMVDAAWICVVAITTVISATVYINVACCHRASHSQRDNRYTIQGNSPSSSQALSHQTQEEATPLISDEDFAERKRAVPKNGRYLLVYLICWLPRTVWFVLDLLDYPNNDWFNTVSNATCCLVGAANVITYGTMPPEKVFHQAGLAIAKTVSSFFERRLTDSNGMSDLDTNAHDPDFLSSSASQARRLDSAIVAELDSLGATSWVIDRQFVKLTHTLGEGATSVVYAGVFAGRPVAVKKMRHVDRDEALRLLREAKLWSHLRHPNVLSFLGLFVTPPATLHFVSPRCKSSLSAELDRRPEPNLTLRLQWALEVAGAMSYLHDRRVLHRDLKTDNVLIDSNQQALVSDFGCAKVSRNTQTRLQDVFGSADYLAPELLDPAGLNVVGHTPYSNKIDVYAFGILLWRIETCEPLYPEVLSRFQLYHAVLYENLRPPLSNQHPRLEVLMEECWHSDPGARPDFDTIHAELTEICTMKSIQQSLKSHDVVELQHDLGSRNTSLS